jgi:taurine dioxygenase
MSVGTEQAQVRRLGGTLAAEVAVDMTAIDEAAFQLVHKAFLDHCVLVFRNQELDPESHIAFTKWFGEIYVYPQADVPGYPELTLIANMRKEQMDDGVTRRVTEVWHPDSTWLERPPSHAILAAKELPEAGGDTLFANQYAAYDALSDAMKAMLAPLRAIHRPPDYMAGNLPERAHPVVITHPETGRKILYVNNNAVRRFDGMTEEESRGLLQFLFAHQVRPDFVYRHRWQPGDVVMWDNRCTQHYAVDDYGTASRVLARTSITGTPPSA